MQRIVAVTRPVLTGRQLIRRALQLLAIAIIASCIVTEAQAAKPYSIGNASQNGFVAACRENGGTTRRLATRVVECVLPNGYVIVCNFNSGLCIDYPPAIVANPDAGGTETGTASRSLVGQFPILPSSQITNRLNV